MTANITLTDRLIEINNASLAWRDEDPSNRSVGLLCTDGAHWAEYGVHTGADLDHYLLATNVYEATRSVFGYKPRWDVLMGSSMEELQAEYERIESHARSSALEEAAYHESMMMSDKYDEELKRREEDLRIEGELIFTNGCWQ